jgi:hypothetical protein
MLKVSSELEKEGFALDLPSEEQSTDKKSPIKWRNASTGAVLPWMQDPYDPEIQGPCLRNMADAPEHDAGFPQHPLTRVRKTLQCLSEGIRFSADLKKRIEGKKRWGFW